MLFAPFFKCFSLIFFFCKIGRLSNSLKNGKRKSQAKEMNIGKAQMNFRHRSAASFSQCLIKRQISNNRLSSRGPSFSASWTSQERPLSSLHSARDLYRIRPTLIAPSTLYFSPTFFCVSPIFIPRISSPMCCLSLSLKSQPGLSRDHWKWMEWAAPRPAQEQTYGYTEENSLRDICNKHVSPWLLAQRVTTQIIPRLFNILLKGEIQRVYLVKWIHGYILYKKTYGKLYSWCAFPSAGRWLKTLLQWQNKLHMETTLIFAAERWAC